ncbi:MAG: threonylcarbamoyl-AMP synthase [Sphingobacteriales bacterium]|nr:threonylcarbamoyl-AMP synthase [Sphingobacteriales bacterium]
MQAIIGTDISYAKLLLQKGELVAIPTETVYGLAGNALNEDAVVKIFTVKNRPQFNPLIIHIPSFDVAQKYVTAVPEIAKTLARHFLPGPLTLLLPKKEVIPDIVTAGSKNVAIRVPDHILTRELLSQLDFPLAAPSANSFGYVSPTSAKHVYDGLNDKIPYILDGGECMVGLESTIIGFDENENLILYRTGGISIEDIEKVTGVTPVIKTNESDLPDTPGQLKSHYATDTPLYLGNISEMILEYKEKKIAVISFHEHFEGIDINNQFILSPSGSLEEAAKNLFKVLRKTDDLNVDIILTERLPDEGLGRAINDRLGRAQHINK